MTLFTATHLLDEVAEAKLMPFLRQPLKDILVMVRDTGMIPKYGGCELSTLTGKPRDFPPERRKSRGTAERPHE